MIVYPSATITSAQVTNYINTIFKEILGRAPSATEMSAWYKEAYTNKNINTLKTLESSLYASEEFIQKSAAAGITAPAAKTIIEIKEKPKAGVLVVVSAAALWLLSLI